MINIDRIKKIHYSLGLWNKGLYIYQPYGYRNFLGQALGVFLTVGKINLALYSAVRIITPVTRPRGLMLTCHKITLLSDSSCKLNHFVISDSQSKDCIFHFTLNLNRDLYCDIRMNKMNEQQFMTH